MRETYIVVRRLGVSRFGVLRSGVRRFGVLRSGVRGFRVFRSRVGRFGVRWRRIGRFRVVLLSQGYCQQSCQNDQLKRDEMVQILPLQVLSWSYLHGCWWSVETCTIATCVFATDESRPVSGFYTFDFIRRSVKVTFQWHP